MSERSDRELVELAQRGDGAAISELFSRYWRAARAVAFAVTGELASAEDAAAEAFRLALAGMDSLQDPNRFGSWLRTIVVRKARLELQRHPPTVCASVNNLFVQSERPDDARERIELAVLIQQAVRELPVRLREAIALFYFEGYDTEAAARFLGVPAGTLRRRLHDGREQLRRGLERSLRRGKQMNEERERQIGKLRSLIGKDEFYQGFREALSLRPPPRDLIHLFIQRQMGSNDLEAAVPRIRDITQRFLRRSERAADPNHPVGSIAAAIRRALPDFQDWPLDAGEATVRFLASMAEHSDRLRFVMPPGFAEGRPGAFLRATRALLCLSENGPVQSVYQLLLNSPDERAFRSTRDKMRISDVLDLTWIAAGPLELRSVQEMLERLSCAVLPGTRLRFSAYDEPRYRSALQLQVGDFSARAAHGGVLAEWPGCPQGFSVAHVRVFLEPWAMVQSGQVVEFDQLPPEVL